MRARTTEKEIMGWCSGSKVAADVWEAVREHIPKRKRKKVALEIIDIFQAQDCDTIEEACQLCEDAEY